MTKSSVLTSIVLAASGAIVGNAPAQLAADATQGGDREHAEYADIKQDAYQQSFADLELRLELMLEDNAHKVRAQERVMEWCDQLGFSTDASYRILDQTMARLVDFERVMSDPLNKKWVPAERRQPTYRAEDPFGSRAFARVRPWPDARVPYQFSQTIVDAIEDGCDADDANCIRAEETPANFFAVVLAFEQFTPVQFVGYDPEFFDDTGFITIETNGPDNAIGLVYDAAFEDGFIEVESVVNNSAWADFHTSSEVLAHIVEALRRAGLKNFRIRIGDLRIFRDLLTALDLPERWRQRLRAHFWQPEAFRAELREMTTRPAASIEGLPDELISAIRGSDIDGAERAVVAYLEANQIEPIGTRSVNEIAASLMGAIEDAQSRALPEATAALIERYLSVVAPARAAGARMKDLMHQNDVDLGDALDAYQRRLKFLAELPVEPSAIEFRAEFGRALEYYTGFVFEVISDTVGETSPIAGGGRYDGLMRVVGATVDVPAVGAMIHTERLLAAVSEA